MEYVKGIPLTIYCDEARLSVAERLALFVPVCQAVQHAHQKGIIHRDLKPSNILVCLYDGQPVPKVIDFGLAKAMHQSLTEHTLHTAHGLMMGTPLYMSPEQAELNNLDVDTRTDIYALGVILYELLTGTTPLERQRLKEAAWQEMLRLIKEEEPPRPSARLSGSGALPSVAAQRKLEPVQLTRLLRGELDWIVMKALEKERSRRYETANGFARDIQRYLADETVEACPPSTGYRLRKFVRKHRAALTTAATILLLLVVGVAASTWQAIRATQAEEQAAQDRDTALKAHA
jgi:serine/threonine protein kinase